MMLTEKEFAYWDTGWACWVAWAGEDVLPKETVAEFWGAGRGVGIYPVRGAQGVVLVGPKATMEKAGRVQFAEQIREQFGKMTGPIAEVVRAVSRNRDAFFWDLHDCRCSVWSRGRVALLGDAAVGFLPTAGVGASMAMLSAAALADELSRADAAHIEYALRLYERHERQKVESAQENSRKLARMMLIESTPLAWGRDQLMRFYTLDRALRKSSRSWKGRSRWPLGTSLNLPLFPHLGGNQRSPEAYASLMHLGVERGRLDFVPTLELNKNSVDAALGEAVRHRKFGLYFGGHSHC